MDSRASADDRKRTAKAEPEPERAVDETVSDMDQMDQRVDDTDQFQGVSGASASAPERPVWPSLDAAVESLAEWFRTSHGLSVDKAKVEDFIAYYRSHAFPLRD